MFVWPFSQTVVCLAAKTLPTCSAVKIHYVLLCHTVHLMALRQQTWSILLFTFFPPLFVMSSLCSVFILLHYCFTQCSCVIDRWALKSFETHCTRDEWQRKGTQLNILYCESRRET